jgi:RNA polymerase sigma factor (sigma-70 family)
LNGLDDDALLQRFEERGDEVAFEALVRRHGPMVLRICRSVLRDEHDSRDAYQATFLILARRAGSIRQGSSVAPWLFAVARRVSRRALVDARRRSDHERRAAIARPEAVQADPAVPQTEILEEIDRLPDRLRGPVILCYLQGHTYESAASMLGCPPRTVHSRLRAARDRLRRRLTRRGLAPSVAALGGASAGHAGTAISTTTSATSLARLAVAITSGKSSMAGAVPASVLTLMLGASRMMMFQSLKTTAVGVLLLVGSAGLVPVLATVDIGDGDRQGDEPRAAPVEQPPPPDPARPRPEEPPPSSAPPPLTESELPPLPDILPLAPPPPEPGLRLDQLPPKPWETVVRIRVHERGSLGFGSGTVIDSNAGGSIILTCAHIFSVKGKQPSARQFNLPVMVELFDGELGGPGDQTVRPVGEPIPGEVIDYDFDLDVALVRIRPGREVKASPVVPSHWTPQQGMPMITTGCSHGEDATAWNTVIYAPSTRYRVPGKKDYDAIECQHSPKQGRNGGGLFTEDGYLAGVCNFSFDLEVGRGLYAAPGSIYRLLDRNGLGHLHNVRRVVPAPIAPPPLTPGDARPPGLALDNPSPAAIDQGSRLDQIERRLDRVLGAIEGRADSPGPGRPASVEDAFREGLLLMLESGPIRPRGRRSRPVDPHRAIRAGPADPGRARGRSARRVRDSVGEPGHRRRCPGGAAARGS